MSIYSGFATRQQQQTYDQLIQDLIFVMQKRILKFYNNEHTDQSKFLDVLIHLHMQLAKMQESKYLQPNTSKSFEDLLRFMLQKIGYFESSKKNGNGKQTEAAVFYNASPQRNNLKSAGNTAPLTKIKKVQRLDSAENKLQNHKNSLSRLNQHSSIGKIIKQFTTNRQDEAQNNQTNNSLADSRNTFINNNPRINNNNANQHNDKQSPRNPEDIDNHNHRNMKFNQTQIQFKSRFMGKDKSFSNDIDLDRKEKTQKQKNTRDYLVEYLEKNNKNYLKGYRKRQVKVRGYSKQYSAYP